MRKIFFKNDYFLERCDSVEKKKKKGFYNDMVSAKCKLIFHVILLNYSYITVSKNEIVFQ